MCPANVVSLQEKTHVLLALVARHLEPYHREWHQFFLVDTIEPLKHIAGLIRKSLRKFLQFCGGIFFGLFTVICLLCFLFLLWLFGHVSFFDSVSSGLWKGPGKTKRKTFDTQHVGARSATDMPLVYHFYCSHACSRVHLYSSWFLWSLWAVRHFHWCQE